MKPLNLFTRMPDPGCRSARNPAAGFTLLEVLVAISILAIACTLVFSTFTTTLKAYARGTLYLEDIHHGDYVMEQLVMAMRSAAFFENTPHIYGMRMDDGNAGRYDGDSFSIVTASSAFMRPDDDLAQGIHRLKVSIEKTKDGDPAVAIRAMPFLSVKDEDDFDPWFVSREVQGMNLRFYNFQDEDWEEEWENTNHVPALVEVTLIIPPVDTHGKAIELKRAVEIPLGTTNWVTEADLRREPTGGGGDGTQ